MKLSKSLKPRVLSVHDSGARGDGMADDSGAIQKALDGPYPIVSIPPGVYRLEDTLRIGSGKSMIAAPDAVFRFADGAGRNAGSFLLTNKDHISGNEYIEVQGGIWDGNNQGNTRGGDGNLDAYTGVALNFVNVEQLRLTDMTIRNPDSFSIRLGETRHFAVENIRFDHTVSRPNQDGVHIGGFCEDGYIRNLRALTPNTPNDDMVALNADDNIERALNLGMKRGPIRNMHIEELRGDSVYTFVRLLSETQRIENIRIRDISGGCRCYAINMDNWAFSPGSGDIRNIDIRHVYITKVPEAPVFPLIDVRLGVRDLLIEDFERAQDDPSPAPTLVVDNLSDNTIQLNDISPHDLEHTKEEGNASVGMIRPFPKPDNTLTYQAIIQMQDNSKLVLARGGIKRMAMNREMAGEEELTR